MAKQERGGAAHRIVVHQSHDYSSQHQPQSHVPLKGWGAVNTNWSTPQGQVVSERADVNEYGLGNNMRALSRPSGGYVGTVERTSAAVGGADVEQFQAGPVRTQRRAEIAAESLGRRAELGKDVDSYRRGQSSYMTHAELNYEG